MRSSRLLTFLAFALLLVSCASDDPLEPDEEESFENLYVPTEYADISEAAAAAVAGDTIRVSAGEYEEDVLLPAGVMLFGAGYEHARLIGGLTVADSDRSVRVEGFYIRNEFGSGILLQDTNLRLSRCYVESCTTAGIEIALPTLGTLRVRVTDAAMGEPLTGVGFEAIIRVGDRELGFPMTLVRAGVAGDYEFPADIHPGWQVHTRYSHVTGHQFQNART